ncbi:MAG: hypothetical protein NTX66_02570 [Candidatus Falkowbacteria bacterium]|nr:hypothetical protein [Candidatus Falkowbacteria bacterium]
MLKLMYENGGIQLSGKSSEIVAFGANPEEFAGDLFANDESLAQDLLIDNGIAIEILHHDLEEIRESIQALQRDSSLMIDIMTDQANNEY